MIKGKNVAHVTIGPVMFQKYKFIALVVPLKGGLRSGLSGFPRYYLVRQIRIV